MSQFLRRATHIRPLSLLLALAAFLAAVSLSCSVGQAVVGRQQAAIPTPTKTPRPTFTPLSGALTPRPTPTVGVRGVLPPGVTVQPPDQPTVIAANGSATPSTGSMGVTNLVIYATETSAPSPTPEPAGPTATATSDVETNRPTREAGPRPLPTPYVIVKAATLNGRRGPATTFERIGEAKQNEELMILGRTEDGAWWQVCCLANQPVWVTADAVEARGPVESVPVVAPPSTPTPVPPRPHASTATPVPTALPPFDIARGPEFPIRRDNGVLTVWVKVYEGPLDNQKPLEGYILKIKRDGSDVSANDLSFADRPFDKTSVNEGSLDYNLKFELYDAGEADWEIYLARPGGFRVSPVTKFTTKGDSYRNLVMYIAYWLAR